MEPISRMISNSTVYVRNKVTGGEEQTKQEKQNINPNSNSNSNSNQDTYLPEEPTESMGRYWLGKDENGNPKVYVDEQKQLQDTTNTEDKQKQSAKDVKKQSTGNPITKCTVNTDKVDQEIQKLKEKKAELEQKLRIESEDGKKQKLEQELSQVEQELRRKDNDAYKRQHAEYTFS